jgi:hypothetical protein
LRSRCITVSTGRPVGSPVEARSAARPTGAETGRAVAKMEAGMTSLNELLCVGNCVVL